MYGLTKKEKLDFILKKVEELSITAYDIGKKTGLSVSGIDKILNNTVKNTQEKTLNILIDYLEDKVRGTEIDKKIHILEEPNQVYETKINVLEELKNCEQEKNKFIIEIYKLQNLLRKNHIEFKNIFDEEDF